MKKGALLLGVLALTLAGCSASKPDMYVEDGAYNLSAQEYIRWSCLDSAIAMRYMTSLT